MNLKTAVEPPIDADDGGKYTTMQFTLQVTSRLHLAHSIMRELRRIPEVVRITRMKN